MHPDLENLINMALADGEINEKKREIILRKAVTLGEDKDEIEMILDGRQAQLKKQSKQTQETAGNTITCPQCKAAIPSFTTKCEYCGHEFRNLKATSTVQELSEKLNAIESLRKGEAWGDTEDQKLANQKSQIISSFPVPNSKEDIMEFLSMAISGIKSSSGTNASNIIRDAWLSKSEQLVIKAKLSFQNDSQIQAYILEFEKIIKSKRLSIMSPRTIMIIFIVLIVILGALNSKFHFLN